MKSLESKRGDFLLEEGAKIIMAVLGLIVLFGLGFALFSLVTQKTANNQAREHLDVITNIIENMDAENNYEEYVLLSPKDWSLVSWPIVLDNEDEFKPSNCKGDSCICICPQGVNYLEFIKNSESVVRGPNLPIDSPTLEDFISKTEGICEEEGFCKNMDKSLSSYYSFNSQLNEPNGLTISINDLMKNKQTVKFYYLGLGPDRRSIIITNVQLNEEGLI